MTVDDLRALSDRMPPAARLLGLDLGGRTIGLAISDLTHSIATPMRTIRRSKFRTDAKLLTLECQERNVGGLVIGLPVNMDGTEGPRAQSTRAFARNLTEFWDAADRLPIAFWDERMSTRAVERAMLEADLSRSRRAQLVDKMAAAYILQGALDALNGASARQGTPPGPSGT